ncbi:chromate ion transporter, putative [Talaromyces stipitatus ATCC 10500]|uniref:Chromate ion transporter, putative n=1 Tax=Talaromyces stipitatus (strain ATCC 10500 / CBS 375.48 / QM 6759 / NRRL 1006) TaxID=441959 RepID=B8LXW7_TALSN|nr:chromate ion transporter, putative [Talaromyces stipitatus ATCC 10500]EED22782.1 chromate ion transporter, putative [Talaromyces stipitatus ATCC 10500]
MMHATPITQNLSALKSLIRRHRSRRSARIETGGKESLLAHLVDVFLRTWDLGFTAFGGPPVHFGIFHRRFVEGSDGEKWVDEQTYQELFAICQALPGPGSTKMLFCLALLHSGFIPAIVVFLIWSLPGAIGMYALSLGVQHIGDTLPSPVYGLLTGMNASTVGIIALAAVQLAGKAIKDKFSRILVVFGACAGMCYSALWYFPVLMVIGGVAAVVWYGWMMQSIRKLKSKLKRRKSNPESQVEEAAVENTVALEGRVESSDTTIVQRRNVASSSTPIPDSKSPQQSPPAQEQLHQEHAIKVRVGIAITVTFFASFIGVMVGRGVKAAPDITLDLFANMYLAGTIIFGGGPVVIPLLRSYVVGPGWVSGRDFLIGLAIIQAWPGPNFNFAVYLGALALRASRYPTVLGAILGFLGIFIPGITLAVAVQSFWRVLRKNKWVVDLLHGLNATAVGLVFTAVYRLWNIGYLTPEATSGQSLALDPWWVVVATVTYTESAWFGVPPAAAIVIGAVLGLCWYGVVST